MGMYAVELITFILILLGPFNAINSLKKKASIETLAKELEKIFTKIYNEKRFLSPKSSSGFSEANFQNDSPSSIPPPPPSPTQTGSIPPPPLPEQAPFSTPSPPPQTVMETNR